MIPFTVIEGVWVIRNYISIGQLVPLQTRVTYNDGELFNKDIDIKWIAGDFSKSFGGDHIFWNPRGITYWFFNEDSYTAKNPFPKQLFNDNLTLEDLEKAKEKCILINSKTLPYEQEVEYKSEVISTFNEFHNNYKSTQFFHYAIVSRLIHLKKFIFHSGVYNIPFPAFKDQNIFQKLFKLFYAILYLFVFVFGFTSSLYLLVFKRSVKWVVLLIPLYLFSFFPFVLKMHEYRFNTLGYPFLLIAACHCLLLLIDYFNMKMGKNGGK
jgi:hypothetical protein